MSKIGKAFNQVRAKAQSAVEQKVTQAKEKANDPKVGRAKDEFKAVVLNRESWGVSIGVDDGIHPRPFGYGEHSNTLVEGNKQWHTETHAERRPSVSKEPWRTTTTSHGVHARAFGDASKKTLSGALGVELEAGGRTVEKIAGQTTDTFAGVRARAYVEGGLLGATAGAEGFAGIDRTRTTGTENGGKAWGTAGEQGWAGLRGVAKAHIGPSSSIETRLEGGAGYRFQFRQHAPLSLDQRKEGPGGLGVVTTSAFDLFAGAKAGAGAGIGVTGAHVGADAFAGARMGLEEAASIAVAGQEVVGVKGRVEGWVGVGAEAHASIGFDWETKSLSTEAKAGLAIGAGGSIDLGGTIAGEQILDKAFGADDREASVGPKKKLVGL